MAGLEDEWIAGKGLNNGLRVRLSGPWKNVPDSTGRTARQLITFYNRSGHVDRGPVDNIVKTGTTYMVLDAPWRAAANQPAKPPPQLNVSIDVTKADLSPAVADAWKESLKDMMIDPKQVAAEVGKHLDVNGNLTKAFGGGFGISFEVLSGGTNNQFGLSDNSSSAPSDYAQPSASDAATVATPAQVSMQTQGSDNSLYYLIGGAAAIGVCAAIFMAETAMGDRDRRN